MKRIAVTELAAGKGSVLQLAGVYQFIFI